jgi:hypothetical protein
MNTYCYKIKLHIYFYTFAYYTYYEGRLQDSLISSYHVTRRYGLKLHLIIIPNDGPVDIKKVSIFYHGDFLIL